MTKLLIAITILTSVTGIGAYLVTEFNKINELPNTTQTTLPTMDQLFESQRTKLDLDRFEAKRQDSLENKRRRSENNATRIQKLYTY